MSVGASAVLRHTTIRGLPLPGVAPVTVAATWREITPGLKEFLGLVGRTARVLTAANGVGPGPASITPEAALAALKAVAASAPAPASPVTRKQK